MASRTHEFCVGESAKLAALLGPGWEPRIWENMGWHWSIKNRTIDLHPNYNYFGGHEIKTYTAFLNAEGQGGGIWTYRGDTPIEAIEGVLDKAQEEVINKVEIWSIGTRVFKATKIHQEEISK